MKIFFDTEFVEDGKTIDLISIGMVREDGAEFYSVSREFDIEKATLHPFVSKHVLPIITQQTMQNTANLLWRRNMASAIREFVGPDPEFWADFGAYDWVALCQLYGTMMDLPKGWPMFVRDVQQFRKMLGVDKFRVFPENLAHDALFDAHECKARYDRLKEISAGRTWDL